jgi:hypothetical protein
VLKRAQAIQKVSDESQTFSLISWCKSVKIGSLHFFFDLLMQMAWNGD